MLNSNRNVCLLDLKYNREYLSGHICYGVFTFQFIPNTFYRLCVTQEYCRYVHVPSIRVRKIINWNLTLNTLLRYCDLRPADRLCRIENLINSSYANTTPRYAILRPATPYYAIHNTPRGYASFLLCLRHIHKNGRRNETQIGIQRTILNNIKCKVVNYAALQSKIKSVTTIYIIFSFL